MLLNLLQELVNRAVRFEEIISGSTSGLAHIDVKVDDLLNMVMETGRHFGFAYFLTKGLYLALIIIDLEF